MASSTLLESTDVIEVSVVMPCLDEARTVGRCVAKARTALESLGIRHEIVVADNGSSDASVILAQEQGAKVVHVRQRGYGSALQAGIAAAQGQFVIIGDADDSYDFSELKPFIERLRAGDDLVMGNRFTGDIRPGAMPWHHRYIGNPVLTGILNLFFRTPIGDAHCGLRAFRKDAYARLGLTSRGMEFASEMVVKASLQKQRISEVAVILHPDGRDRHPHLRSVRDGWRHLRFLLLMCPLWLYLIPSLFIAGAGLALMVWLTPGLRVVKSVGMDVHTMLLGSMLLILGYQTSWLWMFAKIHAGITQLLPADRLSMWLLHTITLERGLAVGGIILSIGLGLDGWLCYYWWDHDFGALDVAITMRYALWGCTLIILGVQTIYGSFFLSLLQLTQGMKQSSHF